MPSLERSIPSAKSRIQTKEIFSFCLFIKDHKPLQSNLHHPTHLIVSAHNFTLCLSKLASKSIERTFWRAGISFECHTLKKTLHLKRKFEDGYFHRDKVTIVSLNIKDMYPHVRQNNIQANKQRLKGLLRKPRYSQWSTGTQVKNKSTGTCKSTSTQLVRSAGTQLRSRSTGTCKSASTLVVPSRSTSTPVGNNARLGTARLVKLTWQVGVSGNKETKQ